jgi:PAS domain S-box-containing protein
MAKVQPGVGKPSRSRSKHPLTKVGAAFRKRARAARAREIEALKPDLASLKRRAAIQQLRSKAFMEATDSSMIVNRGGKIVDLNKETERAYGWTRAELMGRPLQTIMPPEWRALCSERMMQCLQGAVVRNVESERWNKSGERIPVLSTYSLLTDERGQPTAIAVLTKDITELRKVETDLKRNQQELRGLSARLLAAAEEEGKKIARELHDSFGPRLARLNLKVCEVEGSVASQPDLAERLRQISTEIGETAKAVHDLSRLLHPAALSQLGLESALEAECATFSKLRGITVNFSAESVPESLPETVALCLYRVAQEALQNIRKHAQTKTASITLAGRGHDVVMVIQDYGRGFDINAVRGRGGLGLISMEERVWFAKGRLSIASKLGEGTQVEVRIPVGGS